MQDLKCFDFAIKQEVERNILTALLMSNRAYEIIDVIWNGKKNGTEDLRELFDCTFYGDIFCELWKMYKNGEKIDPVTLANKLEDEGVKLSHIMDIMRDSSSVSADTKTVMMNAYALLGMYWEGVPTYQI